MANSIHHKNDHEVSYLFLLSLNIHRQTRSDRKTKPKRRFEVCVVSFKRNRITLQKHSSTHQVHTMCKMNHTVIMQKTRSNGLLKFSRPGKSNNKQPKSSVAVPSLQFVLKAPFSFHEEKLNKI